MIPDLIRNSCRATRNHRWILFQLDPYCYWCGGSVEWKTPLKFDDNAATIDHIGGHRRFRKQFVVLSCNACNQMRSWIFEKYRTAKAKLPWTSRQENRLQIAIKAFSIRYLFNVILNQEKYDRTRDCTKELNP